MRAAYLNAIAGYEGLVIGALPVPQPGLAEILVKIHATAVTPTELQWFPTFNTKERKPRPFPIILGHEFSGVIAAVRNGVMAFSVGDAVYGMNDWFVNGAQAEYCETSATAIALKPAKLAHAQASVVPISALTAWQGLFDRGKMKTGERVLIHGAAGGVGVFAVQLAHWQGAHVIATASARNLDFVRELGASEVIDYKAGRFEELVRDIDVVFDSVGGETIQRSWNVLRRGGRLVTIATQNEATTDRRARDAFFIVEPNQTQLTEIARLLDEGIIRPFVEGVLPLEQAREAFARAERGGMRGKITLEVTAN